MKLRRFVAPTMAAALGCVKDTLGPDAMILETRAVANGEGGVEVTAAVDDEPVTSAAPPSADADLAAEVRELSQLVRTLVARAWVGRSAELTPGLGLLYTSLVSHGVDGNIAASLIEETAVRMAGGVELHGAVAAAVGSAVAFGCADEGTGGGVRGRGERRVHVFYGPPGEGKTTTIAKLAGRATVERRRRVGLVSTDTYRIGGAGELGAYARILGARLAVVSRPDELRGSVECLRDVDEIFVDTAGVTAHDGDQREALKALADAVPEARRILVVSATAAPAVTRRVWETLRSLRPDTCIVTKVDEAPAVGALEVLWRQQLPLAFFGTGRRVPQDLEAASPERMAARLLAA